jgi:putative peptidoglycan lipid II flippase
VLAIALWFAAQFATFYLARLSAFRDEIALILLVLTAAVVYSGLILALFGKSWLRSLVRS